MVVVELLIFMCINKLLVGTGDPPGMIYPAGYGSGEIFMTGTGLEWPYPMEIYPLPSLAVQCRRGKSPC